MPRAERPPLPQSLGRYHLIEELESDALGRLSFARFEGPGGFQRWATVRTLEGPVAEDPSLVAAFHVAARALACVLHPNVASPFEAGEESEAPPWMALEYPYGERVDSIVARVRRKELALPWEIAARIVADAAHGIHALRELARPAPSARHLLVGFDGRTRVLEGCLGSTDDAGGPAALAARLKKAWQRPVDASDDVLRLGMILRSLTNDSSPASLLVIVKKAVARAPGERPGSARRLAREIEALLVSARFVVTTDDVSRFMRQAFAGGLERHDARLRAAQHTTEIFRRKTASIELTDADFEEIAPETAPEAEPDTTREPEAFVDYHDAGDTQLMPTEVMRRRSTRLQGARRRTPLPPSNGARKPTGRTEPMVLPPRPPLGLPARLASLVPQAPARRPSPPRAAMRPPATESDVGVYAPAFDAPAAYAAPAPAVVRSVAPPADAVRPGRSWLWLPLVAIAVGALAAVAFWFTRTHPDAVARLLGAMRVSASRSAMPAASPAVPRPAVVAPVVQAPKEPASVPAPAPPSSSAARVGAAIDVMSLPEAPASKRSLRARQAALRAAARQQQAQAPSAPPASVQEMGMLTVVCVPACDEVLDGGRSLGPSPVFKVPAAAGAHTLSLRGSDAQKSVTVVVKPETVSFVRVELE